VIPVYITKEAREKLWAYVLSVSGEVGGFGFATLDTQDRLVWYDCFLVDQDADASGVDFTDVGLQQAIERAAESKFFDDPNGVWVWWHSHGALDVFWSTTDEGGIEALRQSGVQHMISVVANHKLQTKTRIDVFDVPIIGHAEFHDAGLRRYTEEEFQYEVNDELKAHVRIKPPVAKTTSSGVPDITQYTKEGICKSKWPGNNTGFKWDNDRKMYFRPYTEEEKAERKLLPPGTRKSDPGDKLDEALVNRAAAMAGEGYREYSQEELTGMTPEERQAWGNEASSAVMEDVADDGEGFNWGDVLDYIPDDDEAGQWMEQGFRVITYQGERFLMEPDANDPITQLADAADGEIVEVHAS